MMSLKYDNERLQQLMQQKGINPSAVLDQQNTSSSEHRLSLGDPAGLGILTCCCIGFLTEIFFVTNGTNNQKEQNKKLAHMQHKI